MANEHVIASDVWQLTELSWADGCKPNSHLREQLEAPRSNNSARASPEATVEPRCARGDALIKGRSSKSCPSNPNTFSCIASTTLDAFQRETYSCSAAQFGNQCPCNPSLDPFCPDQQKRNELVTAPQSWTGSRPRRARRARHVDIHRIASAQPFMNSAMTQFPNAGIAKGANGLRKRTSIWQGEPETLLFASHEL